MVQAERDAQQADDALSRVRRDYQRGALEAEDWNEQRVELTAAREGAARKLAQLRGREAQVRDHVDLKETEQPVLARLSEVREAIVSGSANVDAVRAALVRLFDRFVLQNIGEHSAFAGEVGLSTGDFYIEPVPKPEALRTAPGQVVPGYDEKLWPVIKREPLDLAAFDYNNENPLPFTLVVALSQRIPIPPPVVPTSKVCSECSRDLPFSDYNREPRNRDGHRSNCRACQKIAHDAWRASKFRE